jgi:hypothetical protein
MLPGVARACSTRRPGLLIFAGEAETAGSTRCWRRGAGELKPLYNFMDDLPGSKARRSRCRRRRRAHLGP